MKFEYLSEETERLVIRPLQHSDYQAWLTGFCGRFDSRSPYDEGRFTYSVYFAKRMGCIWGI